MTDAVQTALIASGSAVVGGLLASISQVILHRLEEAKSLRQIYRDKLERIAELVDDTIQWFRDTTDTTSIESLASCGRCESVRQAYVLACLYFPELREPIGRYSNNLIRIHSLLVDHFHVEGLIAGAQALRDPGYEKLCNEVLFERNELEELIGKAARKYNRQ